MSELITNTETSLSPLQEPAMPTLKEEPHPHLTDRLSAGSDTSDRSFQRFHQYSLSGSSTVCSNDSSPTTTCSTVDDSSATETSPDSSPESPPPATFQMGIRPQKAEDDKQNAFPELQRATPPAKKGRNLKNLAVNTSRSTVTPPALTGMPLGPRRQESAPSILSPAFVKPPEAHKKRPSNLGLTILTPSNVSASPKQIRLAIPPTPGFAKSPALRHFQSSPSLPLLAGFPGRSGRPAGLAALDTIFSPLEPIAPASEKIEEDEQNFDIPLSREEKPNAYPEGPICVYAPCIDLYLEPTAAEAREYDVVLNVASEVRNPFDAQPAADTSGQELRIDGGGGIQYAPTRRPSAKAHDELNGSPTTPKATPLSQTSSSSLATSKPDFEYIHIPWEHNSDIVPDLLRLCKLIDERVQDNKRVLIHCQCGVSRSASLVVAYGLYKDPSLSVQEAYDTIKQKSKWIGPNMNLIMQLQEFRSSLARGGVLSSNRGLSPITPTSALSEWTGPFSARSTDFGPHTDSLSARFPPSTARSEHFDSSVTSPLSTTADHWAATLPTGRTRAVSAVRTASAYVDTAGHVVPVLSVIEAPSTSSTPAKSHSFIPLTPDPVPRAIQAVEQVTSPRTAEFATTALTPPQAVESADVFGIMSPTSTDFGSNLFDRSILLGQLGMTTHTQSVVPTRAKSLKAEKGAEPHRDGSALTAPRTLRGKISSPTLRQQHQLQSMQAKLEAKLHPRQVAEGTNEPDETLMSPRATEFTQNPFALAFEPVTSIATNGNSVAPVTDPRSPAQKGASPIIRNIEDFL